MRREKTYRAESVTFVIGGVRHDVPALADRFVTVSEPAPEPEPGDIVVYRERGARLDQDRTLRATCLYREGPGPNEGRWVCSREGERFNILASDVIRVEPSQWGWTGAPATSGAW